MDEKTKYARVYGQLVEVQGLSFKMLKRYEIVTRSKQPAEEEVLETMRSLLQSLGVVADELGAVFEYQFEVDSDDTEIFWSGVKVKPKAVPQVD